jgi:type VI secretion system protein ImpL
MAKRTENKTFIRVFLLAAAVILLVLLVFGVTLLLDWPLWVGLFCLLLLSGVVVGSFFFRTLWLRRREQQVAPDSELAEQGLFPIHKITARQSDGLQELQSKWKAGIATLRGSHLKKQGNPLYALPWYLVIGASGSGKTTALRSARLSSPFLQTLYGAELSGTPNFEWWFLEQAVIIDTAGRYAVPVDEDVDQGEWCHLLRLLVKSRKREPLNGLVVTVAADRLLSGDSGSLADDGRILRRRIDELMRASGVRFPVYLLVTKCDLIQGMHQFVERLPEPSLDQAMGIINKELSADVGGVVGRVFATISDRLHDMRLHLLLRPDAKDDVSGLLLFPQEFVNLKPGLDAFMEGAFGENQYQETPVLRGLFFSSGQRKDSPHLSFPERQDFSCERKSCLDPHSPQGIFLHDFFSRIVPKDRQMFAPTRRSVEWQHISSNLGLVSWIVVGVALCGLLSFSFVKNLSTIRQISGNFPAPPEMRGELTGDLSAAERYRQGIMAVEEHNQHWLMPRFWLTESIDVEQDLKSRFCRQFRQAFLVPLDSRFAESVASFSSAVSDEMYGQYIVHLARRVNLLKARQKGEGYDELKLKPQPSYPGLLTTSHPAATSQLRNNFGTLYLSYLSWRTDSSEITRELKFFQDSLQQLLAVKGGDLRWLVTRVESQGSAKPVTLAEFWGGSRQAANEKQVPAAFTRSGKVAIESLVREIEAALPDQRLAASRRDEFEGWYRSAALASWEAFAAAFSYGSERLKGEGEWQQAAAKMVTEEGPYFLFLNRMAREFETLGHEADSPAWIQQLNRYLMAQAGGTGGESQVVQKAADGGKKLLVSLQKKVGREASAETIESRLAGSQAYRDYRAALRAITPATASRNQAFLAAAQIYSEDPALGKSPFVTAFAATRQIKNGLAAGGVANEVVARLVDGPIDFLWSYLRKETAVFLQSQWEEQVLSGTPGMTGQQAAAVVVGTDGPVWKFVKGPAAPFLCRTVRGYRAKEVLGGAVPFEAALFSFLDRGNLAQAAALTRQSNYSVGIKGLPTDANPGARVMPQATRLELQCGGSTQSLANLNYPVGKTFNWSPDNCGDVQLQIEIGDLVLSRTYLGPQAFSGFLRDFVDGKRIFYPRDFPGESSALAKLGIKYIRVNYQFIGSGQVLKQAASVAGQIPVTIAPRWTP